MLDKRSTDYIGKKAINITIDSEYRIQNTIGLKNEQDAHCTITKHWITNANQSNYYHLFNNSYYYESEFWMNVNRCGKWGISTTKPIQIKQSFNIQQQSIYVARYLYDFTRKFLFYFIFSFNVDIKMDFPWSVPCILFSFLWYLYNACYFFIDSFFLQILFLHRNHFKRSERFSLLCPINIITIPEKLETSIQPNEGERQK